MKKANMKSIIKWIQDHPRDLCEKSAASLLKHLIVESEMKTRDYKFSCGTDGVVVDEITIKIKLTDGLNMQPHTCFEENVVDNLVRSLLNCEIEGWLENVQLEPNP